LSRRWRAVLAAGLLAIAVVGIGQGADVPPPRLQGTFLQLTSGHAAWTDEDWRRLFGYFVRLRISELVVQWTLYDDVAFYPGSRPSPVSGALPAVLRRADEHGMTVTVGLAHDSAYWAKVARDPALVEVYLRTLEQRSLGVARELAPIVAAHRSFAGWYITEEIEDGSWKDPKARAVLFDYVRRLAGSVRTLRPGATVAISGFSNAETDPAVCFDFWRSLLRAAPVDVVMFQDGVGAGKQKLAFLPLYLAAVRDATVAVGRDLQVIVETFQQVPDSATFKAVPAPWERLERQLEIAAAASTRRGLQAFSVPEYMTPLGGPDAERLFERYLTRLRAKPD
jgi:hypothetical protein